MVHVVRAFPLIRPVEELDRFVAELNGERGRAVSAFYSEHGVSHESWHLQETPTGPIVISVTEIEHPEGAGARYAEANEEFVAWYKDQIRNLSGIDPNTTPLGPPTTQKFFWERG